MARQKEISNSLGGNKIGSCNSCGQRQRLATSCLDEEREAERLPESTRANARDSENSRASQEQDDDRIGDRDEIDPYNEDFWAKAP
jgi:hypothetical protein